MGEFQSSWNHLLPDLLMNSYFHCTKLPLRTIINIFLCGRNYWFLRIYSIETNKGVEDSILTLWLTHIKTLKIKNTIGFSLYVLALLLRFYCSFNLNFSLQFNFTFLLALTPILNHISIKLSTYVCVIRGRIIFLRQNGKNCFNLFKLL